MLAVFVLITVVCCLLMASMAWCLFDKCVDLESKLKFERNNILERLRNQRAQHEIAVNVISSRYKKCVEELNRQLDGALKCKRDKNGRFKK